MCSRKLEVSLTHALTSSDYVNYSLLGPIILPALGKHTWMAFDEEIESGNLCSQKHFLKRPNKEARNVVFGLHPFDLIFLCI